MNKNDIKVGEETAAVITAAVAAYLGHGDFTFRSIKPFHECKKSMLSKKSQFVSWKTNN